MVKDRFNNICTAITNNKREIEVDLMGKQKSAIFNTVGNSQALLLLDIALNDNLTKITLFGCQIMRSTILVILKTWEINNLHSFLIQILSFCQVKNQYIALIFLYICLIKTEI